jgi:uncharacterized protein YdeI (YjbR/CyaY-like superfamily)
VIAGEHLQHVEVPSEQALRDWLAEHHDQQAGVWIVTWKKHVADRHVTHEQVLDQLVAFGWTDGIARRIDDDRTRQLVSPRRTKPWAKSYKDRAERLIAEGRMHRSGLAAVEQAKATGMWDAMNDVDALQVPDDLTEALHAHPPAATHFHTFPPSVRRSILRWIASARTSETRTRRIARTVTDAQRDVQVKSHG